MTLRRLIRSIEGLRKELAVFNVADPRRLREELAALFDAQNVTVTAHRTPSGCPAGVAVLSDGDGVLELLDVDLLRDLLRHSPGDVLGVADAAYDDLLGHLKETTFTTYDTEQMLYTSREIEDRARRMGQGRLHAGFQRCSVIGDQRTVYADLGACGVDVHTYGVPDVTPPDLDGVRVHPVDADEIATTWFVVYDGGGRDDAKTALLAEQRGEDRFHGVWTYDPGIVDAAVAHLERTYLTDAGPKSRSEP